MFDANYKGGGRREEEEEEEVMIDADYMPALTKVQYGSLVDYKEDMKQVGSIQRHLQWRQLKPAINGKPMAS